MESSITVNDKLTTQSILDIVLSKRLTLRRNGEMADTAICSPRPARCHGKQSPSNPLEMVAKAGGQAKQGLSLFERNCAHCHGDDARGNEGPELYNLAMSDARIAKRIKDGIKGEIPKFGGKLNDGEVAALIAFLRSLNG